ncbi:exosome complex exonuclease RRP44 [Latimeria chalumnae]|uniref:Exosome complex exonuclease RRP44 n=1 Tax=Latimeria chalumnae TaxID=7897 RepID=H3ARK4_LATCH|nr:PREDICTED: exosome complex exonuclease RRP44 [Latimeria chalumnae]XP_014350359.1 PREDICTED: exosome complex exonuclease RRP44 [Latimeria chalumnae]XP_014350360.1 PREDICTED: exosome complex exonuclease RRP44 [Latimeria chalumnae]|eukprot:XP_006006526.1 PREDICTED: exosome complex exonuclease RRP44 [Latimeria chalumnae]
MLRSKTFLKKTRSGGVMKIVREHYLRDDIWCGCQGCGECPQDGAPLQPQPGLESSLCAAAYYILLDTNVVLHQIDILEDPVIRNVIILQTVLQEVRNRSAPVYKRIKDVINNPEKLFYTFTNEHHRETYIEQEKGESANDRNDRAIRVAVKWYNDHLSKARKDAAETLQVILITNDRKNKEKAVEAGLVAYTCEEYIKSLIANPELIDRLACVSDEGNGVESGRIIFPEHLPLSKLQQGIKSGIYFQGSFRASRDNYLEATVWIHGEEGENKEILVQGLKHLNRAIHEDVVAVELLPKKQWVAPSSIVMQDEGADEDDDNEDGKENLQTNFINANMLKPTGRVIGIIKRNWRPYCGMLSRSQIKESRRHLFTPAERRIPRIRIETRQASILDGQRIIVAIDGWPKNSRYPNGHFVKNLGAAGDKDTETAVLLLEHDVPHQPFSQVVLSFLPEMPWRITEEDMKKRADLRHLYVCSVDPPGCTDIDDALHCRELENGNYEVGVHIADVSHFIRPGNALDQEAANRGTTVYLCEKRIDMVPELLSSNLCSLRSNVERFAFSCIWELNQNAEILKTEFMKSVINSKASLTYAEAQMRIDDSSMNDEITKSLRGLNKLAKVLKKKRIDNGALTLSSPEVRFHLDSETHDPIDLQTKELKETNSMVEEFMLLANVSVAEKIYNEFSECALLRKHPAPPPSNYDILIKAAKSKGLEVKTDSAKELADSLDKAEVPDFPYLNTLLRILATRCMMQAVYFCSGMDSDFHHYGLASPIYTHFTSPIRRYSDIIVHRLLAVAITADCTYPELMDKHKQASLCNNLNYRHKMAQYAQRASVAFHTQLFFKAKQIADEEGYILFVRKNAIVVLIPKFGLEGTVFFAEKDKPKPRINYNEEIPSLTVEDIAFYIFDKVKVKITLDASNIQHQKIRMFLVDPVIPEFATVTNQSSQSATICSEPEAKKLKIDK